MPRDQIAETYTYVRLNRYSTAFSRDVAVPRTQFVYSYAPAVQGRSSWAGISIPLVPPCPLVSPCLLGKGNLWQCVLIGQVVRGSPWKEINAWVSDYGIAIRIRVA
jgi:hypothetical protein